MSVRRLGLVGALGAVTLVIGAVAGPGVGLSQPGAAPTSRPAASRHVLVVSVDGLHQSDLDWYVAQHPSSALSGVVGRGNNFTQAQTPVPSDSFPGMVAQLTGGNPAATGVYYDDSYNHALLPPGTTRCAGVSPGTEVNYSEALDKNPNALDAGQGLPGLPGNILAMTNNTRSVIDPGTLPVDPARCTPVYPHDYLRVNTVFQVARAAGLVTAWSDKHAAYDILNGPDTTTGAPAIQDLFTPEINSQADGLPPGQDWTSDNTKTQQYDAYKVRAVLNEVDGYDHSRTHTVGVPGIFGMNFQSVSTAQKLPTSGGQPGGYQADHTPGPVLRSALDFIDTQVGAMLGEIEHQHLTDSTTIILSAKHGQSPIEPAALTRIPDGPILDGLNAAWSTAHPGTPALVAHATDDDAMIMWLSDRSPSAAAFAKNYLLHRSGVGNDITGHPKPYTSSGLQTVYAGDEAATYFGATPGDPAVPDLYAVAQHGTVFTGGTKKVAEHGGADPQDRHVPLVISGAGATAHSVHSDPVETTQIAPTILALLGLNPQDLAAVRTEHTTALPLTTTQPPGPARADLRVALQGIPLFTPAGQQVSATLTITNNGPSDAGAITATVIAPTGYTITADTLAGPTASFTAPSLASGQTLRYPVTLHTGPGHGISFGVAIAFAFSAATPDPNVFNNFALTPVITA